MLRSCILILFAAATGLASAAPALDKLPAPDPKALDLARQVKEASERAMGGQGAAAGRGAKLANEMQRRVDSIANEALQADRDQILKLLGINPKASGGLFYFLSFSMPKELMQAYVAESMWTGGTVVLRGVPPGRTFSQFITEDLQSLVYGKGPSANISIDPRLFDAYAIKAVPAIVYTKDRGNLLCESNVKCAALADDRYFKVSGAVTSDYALRSIIGAGGEGASEHLSALAKGYRTGQAPGKFIKPFEGDWKAAITPEERLETRKKIDAARAAKAKQR